MPTKPSGETQRAERLAFLRRVRAITRAMIQNLEDVARRKLAPPAGQATVR